MVFYHFFFHFFLLFIFSFKLSIKNKKWTQSFNLHQLIKWPSFSQRNRNVLSLIPWLTSFSQKCSQYLTLSTVFRPSGWARASWTRKTTDYVTISPCSSHKSHASQISSCTLSDHKTPIPLEGCPCKNLQYNSRFHRTGNLWLSGSQMCIFLFLKSFCSIPQ